MIALVEREEQRQRLLRLCEQDAFGCKIAGVAGAYGFDKGFACFWLDDRADAAFCLADDVMILSGAPGDLPETQAFLRMAGGHTVVCRGDVAASLGLTVTAAGQVVSKVLPKGPAATEDRGEAPIREIFFLLEEAGMAEDFEPFYLDLSHRLRHGAARVFTQYRGEELTGCAIVSAVSDSAVILSALVVQEPFRRQGLGRGLVLQVEHAFPGKTVYVFREEDRNQEFYASLGYASAQPWVEATR